MMWDDATRRRLVRLCGSITGDRGAAEDLAQETLLEAWRHRRKLTDPSGADRWLAAIARNVCLRWARSRGRTLALDEESVSVEIEPRELADLLDRALELLPPDTRAALVQRYVHDLSHAEIAAALGVSEDALAMRLTRGKVVLRRVLAPDLGLADPWEPTRSFCRTCGRRRLLVRRGRAVSFTCPACGDGEPAVVLTLGDPTFARLVREARGDASLLRRSAAFVRGHFRGGVGARVPCTACGAEVVVRPYRRDGDGPNRRGLSTWCDGCGVEVTASLVSLGAPPLERPAVVDETEHADAVVVTYEDVLTRRQVRVAFDGETLLAR
jgi:RNA polymerase sigma-70 factor (ECF subfamily)